MAYPITEQEAAGLRSSEKLTQLRQQAQSVSQSTVLAGTPESLWPVLAFTDLLNQAVGMQQTDNTYLTRDYGGTWMHAETANSGLAVAYEELPYEWEAPHRYRVERIHSKGPLKYLSFGVEQEPAGQTQTRVTCEIRFVSILPGPVARLLINKEIAKFIRSFQQLGGALAAGRPALQAYFAPLGPAQKQIEAWSQAWQDVIPQEPIRRAIADYIVRAPERMAYRLRPFALAQAYALDPLEVLKACLQLTREGQLDLMWDCRCPGCKGPKESFQQLSKVASMAYCPTCAVSYGLAFDQNLELSFRPAASLRPTTDRYFCAGSPGNTPHISWQQNLGPSETREFSLNLAPGPYVLRSLSSANELILRLNPPNASPADALEQLSIRLANDFETGLDPAPEIIELTVGAQLEIANANGHEVTLMLENPYWQSLAVSAARVQAVQDFHDLFPEEILGEGASLPLQAQIFLCARIRAQADAALDEDTRAEMLSWIESRIRAHQGAAVADSADTLLGLFATPFEALSAAWDLRQELENIHLLYETPIQLELGLVQGPCEVFVDGRRLAYRGPAVERARHAAAASGGEQTGIFVAGPLLQTPEMQLFLEDPLVSREPADSPEPGLRLVFDSELAELLG